MLPDTLHSHQPILPGVCQDRNTDDIENHLQQLNRSECIPFAFRDYATYTVAIRGGTLLLHWVKKKENQEAVEAKAVAPNNKLYLWLLLGATAPTGLSLLVQECDTAFTIWTSITCGEIASIVVAWLIDAVNCRQLNKKADKHREALLANL